MEFHNIKIYLFYIQFANFIVCILLIFFTIKFQFHTLSKPLPINSLGYLECRFFHFCKSFRSFLNFLCGNLSLIFPMFVVKSATKLNFFIKISISCIIFVSTLLYFLSKRIIYWRHWPGIFRLSFQSSIQENEMPTFSLWSWW